MKPIKVSEHQEAVLRDMALTFLRQQFPGNYAATQLLCGKISELDAQVFLSSVQQLADYGSGPMLDVIAELFDMRRGQVQSGSRRSRETDAGFRARIADRFLERAKPDPDQCLIGISLATALRFDAKTSVARQEATVDEAVRGLEENFSGFGPGSRWRINDAAAFLWRLPQVIDVGSPNRPFEQIAIWRDSADGTRTSEPLTADYIVKPGEFLVFEPSLIAPIYIRPVVEFAYEAAQYSSCPPRE